MADGSMIMDKENSKPYTVEDIKEFIAKAEADIQAGKIRTAEESWNQLENMYPWLCE